MITTYEWKVEYWDDYDIVEIDECESYAEALAHKPSDTDLIKEISLVRNTGDDINGLDERNIAYVLDGVLGNFESYGEWFPPKKFRAEVANGEGSTED
jgi:hypothetical protein